MKYRIHEIHEVNGVLTETVLIVTDDIVYTLMAIGICGEKASIYKIYKNGKLIMISKHLGA